MQRELMHEGNQGVQRNTSCFSARALFTLLPLAGVKGIPGSAKGRLRLGAGI